MKSKAMKKYIVLISAILLFSNCIEKKKAEGTEVEKTESTTPVKDTVPVKSLEPIALAPDGSYFKATGTEPFWGLKLYDDRVQLSMMEDTLLTPASQPIRVRDSNISMYRIQTEATQMDIIIAYKECTNAMSGEKSPYTVTIAYKKTGEEETKAFEGCGAYITDYRLHDIWVLEEMNGKTVSKADFNGKDVPNMEININTNRVSGFSGCNRMTGSLFFEKDVLRFTNMATTRMACPNLNAETEFLKTLQSVTSYKMRDSSLYLSNNDQENTLVFKKID
ncbi:MAG: META domain-containing protein [Allomuricauda sp.]